MSDAPPPDLSGTSAGEYLILRTLGVGGMGVVYEGRQPVIGKRVAIKILLPTLSKNADLVARFVAEARAVNAIGHRGIIDIFSFGQLDDGSHYFVMELLEGRDLDSVLRQHRRVPVATALDWSAQVLDALAAAHQVGVIHRDLKPSNLFLAESRGQRWIKLLDFGIAKLGPLAGGNTPQTQASMIIGTPSYMAPEQVTGKVVTPAADLYAMGCVLFELVTGKRAFDATNPMELMFKHVDEAPPIPSQLVPGLPNELDDLVLALLEKDPGRRPSSAHDAHEWVNELRARFVEEPVAFPPVSAVTRLGDASVLVPLDDDRPPTGATRATRQKSKLTPPTASAERAVEDEDDLEPTDPSSRRSGSQWRRNATPHRPATSLDEPLREVEPARRPASVSRRPEPRERSRVWWAVPIVLLLGLIGASSWVLVDRPEPVQVVTPPPPPPRTLEPRRIDPPPGDVVVPNDESAVREGSVQIVIPPRTLEPRRSDPPPKGVAVRNVEHEEPVQVRVETKEPKSVEASARVPPPERHAPPPPRPKLVTPRDGTAAPAPNLTAAKLAQRLERVQARLTSQEAATGPDHVLRRLFAEAKAQAERAQTPGELEEAWSSLTELDAQLDPASAR